MKLRNALTFFLTLFLAFPAFAGDCGCQKEPIELAMNVGMMAGGSEAATQCSTTTDYVGSKTDQSTLNTATYAYYNCYLYAATCSGTTNCNLNTAYAKAYNGDVEKIFVYSSTGSEANPKHASNVLLGYTAAITWASTGITSGAVTASTTITNGQKCWICIAGGSSGSDQYVNSTGTSQKYAGLCGSAAYTTPLANLGDCGDFSAVASKYDAVVYVTIGP